MTPELIAMQKTRYIEYKTLQEQVFGLDTIDRPNTHLTLHMEDAIFDYGPFPLVDCAADEVG